MPKGFCYPKGLTDEKAARMLAALRAGETLRKFAVKGPRFEAYCEAHPEYACEALPLAQANAKAAAARKGQYNRRTTHCKYGHELSGSNLYFERNGRTRRCRICLDQRTSHPPLPSKNQIARVTAALNAGKTVSEICWGISAGKIVAAHIVSFRKLKRYREENPEYDRFVRSMISGNAGRAQQRRHHPEGFRINIIRSEANDYGKVASLVPKGLPPDVRDEVVQSIFLALLEGSLQRDQVGARVREFVKLHNQEANRYGVGKYGLISLDAPIFHDGTGTMGDSISRGLWD